RDTPSRVCARGSPARAENGHAAVVAANKRDDRADLVDQIASAPSRAGIAHSWIVDFRRVVRGAGEPPHHILTRHVLKGFKSGKAERMFSGLPPLSRCQRRL